jgi:hypothetical protein
LRAVLAVVIAAAFACAATAARATEPMAVDATGTPDPQRSLAYEVGPVIGEPGSYPAGPVELLVRVRNTSAHARKGVIDVVPDETWGAPRVAASAPFAVGPASEAFVRIPLRASGGLTIEVTPDDGELPWSSRLYARTGAEVAVTLLAPTSPARPALLGASVMPGYEAPELRGGTGGLATRPVSVHTPRIDPATGDPILPERAIGWAHEDLVVARTDVLARLGGESMEALAGFVLGGGTLALAVTRPEDLRGPRVTALIGGEAAPAPASPEARAPLDEGGIGEGPRPGEATRLSGWSGGNLRPSAYGATATYGLGEVVLLSFDPDDAATVGDPFARGRLLDLARRAFDRRSTIVFDATTELPYGGPADEEVRRQLDPNENTRWTVGVAAMLLLAYAIVAGPVSFSRATRRGRPLRALWHLPLWSLATFLVIVALGAFSKGLSGRSRRITLIDAGAGVDLGVARRWRGFYAARATDVEVRATDRSSFPWLGHVEGAEQLAGARLVAERDGARLVDVPAQPWECVVVREDGFASLGEGIGVANDAAGGVAITNGTGRALRGVLVKQPDDTFRYLPRIEAGATARSTDGEDLAASPRKYGDFLRSAATGRVAGRITVHPLDTWLLDQSGLFEGESPDLGAAWKAVERGTARESTDWFPSGVPVVLAQIDGGEGRTSDSGFQVDRDRLLVRVVGWGR